MPANRGPGGISAFDFSDLRKYAAAASTPVSESPNRPIPRLQAWHIQPLKAPVA